MVWPGYLVELGSIHSHNDDDVYYKHTHAMSYVHIYICIYILTCTHTRTHSHRAKDFKNRELFEKMFPELKARREQQERFTRYLLCMYHTLVIHTCVHVVCVVISFQL